MQWEDLIRDPLAIGIAAAVLVAIVVALVVWFMVRRRRRERLQRRFGTEYQRTVDARGSRREAEHDLTNRRERRERLQVRSLGAGDREGFRARFEEIQASFVDEPEVAVRAADRLLDEVAARRGYEEIDGSTRLEMVSVDHPEEVSVHRRRMARLDAEERFTTEDLRQSLLGARRLMERLVRDGTDGDAAAPEPPLSLLGLDDEDGEETTSSSAPALGADEGTSDASSAEGTRTGQPIGETTARTYSRRPDERNEPEKTIDLTQEEQAREGR